MQTPCFIEAGIDSEETVATECISGAGFSQDGEADGRARDRIVHVLLQRFRIVECLVTNSFDQVLAHLHRSGLDEEALVIPMT